MNGGTEGQRDGRAEGRSEERSEERLEEWSEGRTERRMDGVTDSRYRLLESKSINYFGGLARFVWFNDIIFKNPYVDQQRFRDSQTSRRLLWRLVEILG